jgi:hypothetical protein
MSIPIFGDEVLSRAHFTGIAAFNQYNSVLVGFGTVRAYLQVRCSLPVRRKAGDELATSRPLTVTFRGADIWGDVKSGTDRK